MGAVVVRKGRRTDAAAFLDLVKELARYEHLDPPTEAGGKRLLDDVFRKRRINLLLATDGNVYVGYALYFFSYSSFVAKPTLYIEDIFVLKKYRRRGIGGVLFNRCAKEAARHGCGRMEWSVLTWNVKAMAFYDKLGAKRLDDWRVYRLDEGGIAKASQA